MNFISEALRDGEETIKLYDLHGTLKEMADEYERLKKELIHSDRLSADYIESCDSIQLSLQIKKLEEVLNTPEKSGADVVPGLINVHIELYLAYRWRALLATKALKKNDVPAFVSSDSMNMELCRLLDTRVLPHLLTAAQHLYSAKSILNIKSALKCYENRSKQNEKNASLTDVEKTLDNSHILEAVKLFSQDKKLIARYLQNKNSLSLPNLVGAINQKYIHLVEMFIEKGGGSGFSGGNLLKIYKKLQKETDAATRLSYSIRQDKSLQDGIKEIIPIFTTKT